MTGKNSGWTLIARFSNKDSTNWMKDSGEYWYDRTSAVGQTTDPADNTDMISPAFWLVNGTEFKITRSDDPSHTALLQTTGGCLGGLTFRFKMISYGDFRDGKVWAQNEKKCRGHCEVQYGGRYEHTEGFGGAECDGVLQQRNKIGFWCYWIGNGAVMTIGGAGGEGKSGCKRAAHGIGVTAADEASFYLNSSRPRDGKYDYGNKAHKVNLDKLPDYALNMWVR